MTGVVLARVTADVLRLAECEALVGSPADGAVVGFAGVVRDHDGGRVVTALEYTAHPDAERMLRASAERIAALHPEVTVAAAHRTGALAIGDVALVCAAASAHRAAAFAACAALVDDIKRSVPIWKEQRFADGSSEWVGAS